MARCPTLIRPAGLLMLAAALSAPGAAGAGPSGREADYAVTGNHALSEDEILGALRGVACSAADSACLRAGCDSVAYLYWSLGYLNVMVTCTEGDPGEPARVEIAEGDVSSVEAVEIVGTGDEGRSIIAPFFEEMPGRPFSPERFEDAVARALRAYDDAGYPVASMTPEVAALGETGLKMILTVEEGPRAKLGDIVFEGVVKTRHDVLLREVGLRPGGVYDGSEVAEARRRLMKLGVFESVSEGRLSMNPRDSTLVVTFETVEARTSFVEGAFAYGPTPSGNEAYGQLEVDLRNIAGTLRKAGLYWMKRGSGRTAWAVSYREPRIFHLPVGLEGSVDSDIDEAAYERRRFSLRLVQQDGRRYELSAGYFFAATREGPLLYDGAGEEIRNSYRENGFDIGLVYDGTDRIINPTAGLTGRLRFALSAFNCEDCEEPDRRVWSALIGGAYIFGIAGNTVAYMRVRVEAVGAGERQVPPSHRLRIGGVNTLRGYPEEWFDAEQALLGTAELRYIAGSLSRLYVFLDAASLEGMWRDSGGVDMPLLGYGIGLTTGSRIGVFRVEVATARGEPLSDAKLHLVLTQRF